MVDSGGEKRGQTENRWTVYQRQILQGDRIIRRPMHPVHCTCRRWTRACTEIARACIVDQRGQCKMLGRLKSEKDSPRVTGRHRHEEGGKKTFYVFFIYKLFMEKRLAYLLRSIVLSHLSAVQNNRRNIFL